MIHVHELCGDGVQKRKENFFASISCFLKKIIIYLFIYLLPELLQGLLTT
jgi:hypothetical protein